MTVIEPSLNAAHFVLGGLYEREGQFDRAIERYRMILTTRNDDVRAMNNLAYILRDRETPTPGGAHTRRQGLQASF